jgi:hypothetical protein
VQADIAFCFLSLIQVGLHHEAKFPVAIASVALQAKASTPDVGKWDDHIEKNL